MTVKKSSQISWKYRRGTSLKRINGNTEHKVLILVYTVLNMSTETKYPATFFLNVYLVSFQQSRNISKYQYFNNLHLIYETTEDITENYNKKKGIPEI